ncbi:MAG: hypothetical protein WA177_07390 [Xanthobacteraceae bacterium]|jgi:hypothetical protein
MLRPQLRAYSGVTVCAVFSAVLAVAVGLLSMPQARAATWLEKNFWLSGPNYDRDLPSCEFRPALDRIISDFQTKESQFWNSELGIVGIENIHEIDTMPWAAQSIPRRFCGGTAVINDNSKHTIYYSIGEDTGAIGAAYGVNFCVVGYDRNFAYNPNCRSARP